MINSRLKANFRRIIFFGTPDFAAFILKKLIDSSLKPLACVTQPDKKVGRGMKSIPSPVKKLALKYKIKVLQFEKIREKSVIAKISELHPDLIIVAAFGQILPKEILDLPRLLSLNIHASLLPKYRGPSPIQSAILAGDKKTGVTLMQMSEKMDAGDILYQKEIIIYNNDTAQTLHDRLSRLGVQMLLEFLPRIFDQKIEPKEQDERKATYTKILRKQDGKIDWTDEAISIERKIRAFDPWPGTFCFFQKDQKDFLIKIKKALILNTKIRCAENAKPGDLFEMTDGRLAISCGLGSLILESVQVQGKSEISGEEFLRGYPQIKNFK